MDELNNVLEGIKQKEVDLRIRIATLEAVEAHLKSDLYDCVNELCLQCGRYKTEYLGSCDVCRWQKPRNSGGYID